MATQYFEYYDVSEIAIIEQRVRELTYIRKYAIVVHDQDLYLFQRFFSLSRIHRI